MHRMLMHLHMFLSKLEDKLTTDSVFVRHIVSEDQPTENVSSASIQLSWFESFSTSPIRLSLSKTQVLAWRTRIVSLQGIFTYCSSNSIWLNKKIFNE